MEQRSGNFLTIINQNSILVFMYKMFSMEAIYLLCSILTCFITSLTLSLLVPFQILYRRLISATTGTVYIPGGKLVTLYEGTVFHERRKPVYHSFCYNVRYAFYDLDCATQTSPTDYFSADEARRIAETSGPVFLLTIPPSVGYVMNPVSLYYCYDLADGSTLNLNKCIVEVTNAPWGESVKFVFDPNGDLVAKPLHVSPFMDMLGSWRMRTKAPTDNLYVSVSVEHPELGNYFSATLRAKRVSLEAVDHTHFFWLMPQKVAVWIFWNALKVWWKNVPVVPHPKYVNPGYMEEARKRDRKLKRCPASGWVSTDKSMHSPDMEPNSMTDQYNRRDRWFAWKDAKWPWY